MLKRFINQLISLKCYKSVCTEFILSIAEARRVILILSISYLLVTVTIEFEIKYFVSFI